MGFVTHYKWQIVCSFHQHSIEYAWNVNDVSMHMKMIKIQDVENSIADQTADREKNFGIFSFFILLQWKSKKNFFFGINLLIKLFNLQMYLLTSKSNQFDSSPLFKCI